MNKTQLLMVTMGDPNGVGPEICVKSMQRSNWGQSTPVFVGDVDLLKHAWNKFTGNSEVPFHEIHDLDEIQDQGVYVLNPVPEIKFKHQPGIISQDAGMVSLEYIRFSVNQLLQKKAAAMVTAPISKEAIDPVSPGFQGHTEFIGEMCGDPEPILCLVNGDWVVAHVSTHCSLRQAVDRVQIPRILKTAYWINHLLIKLTGVAQPKIGISGLNPHAGENGLFGDEEIKVIIPAINELKQQGIDAHGPYPADVVFPLLKAKKFHGVVAMYHDQGHAVTKTLAFDLGETRILRGVNATLGLPVIRTSVDHGTGFDIAWKGISDCHSLLDAYGLAWKLSRP